MFFTPTQIFVFVVLLHSPAKAQNPTCVREQSHEPLTEDFGNLLVAGQANQPYYSEAPHPCRRNCSDSVPMKCEYAWRVEWYYTMSKACYDCPCNISDCGRKHCIPVNGVPRILMSANRMVPGPTIEVCEGDQIIVNVSNKLRNGEGLSIHWHGIHQRTTPYMDGVTLLTQCPVDPFTTMRYTFTADPVGTHWWHGHTGMHLGDGLSGALIVRQADEKNRHRSLYDYDLSEHQLLITDWWHRPAVDVYADESHARDNGSPDSLLINGKGKFAAYVNATSVNSTTFGTPREVINVKQGYRYRLRFISTALADAPIKIWVEGHNLTIIATEVGDVEPTTVDALVIFAGERYDVILEANNDVGVYWLKLKGYIQAAMLTGAGVVRYKGANLTTPTYNAAQNGEGNVFQDQEESMFENVFSIDRLKALDNATTAQNGKRTVYLSYDLNLVNNPEFNDPDLYPLGPDGPGYGTTFMPLINKRSFVFTGYPLLTDFDDGQNAEDICEADTEGGGECHEDFCFCPHVIEVKLGQTVELVLIDEGKNVGAIHPFHLHGHSFWVLSQGMLGANSSTDEFLRRERLGDIQRNLDHPPLKDTVMTPSKGYTVIQFVADNPGWWFFHCHIMSHLENGMALVVRVGNQSDLPPIPDNFPQCGRYHKAPTVTTPAVSTPTSAPTTSTPTTSSSGTVIIILSVLVGILAVVIIAMTLGFRFCKGDSRSRPEEKSQPEGCQNPAFSQ